MRHILQEVQLISKAAFLFCALLAGCATGTVDKKELLKVPAPQRVYYSDYDLVWKAAHSVLKYTIANENQETGFLETDYIKGVDGWLPPEQSKPPSAGLRYKFIITFVRGKAEGKDSTRVTIEKKSEVLRDFFSEAEDFPSDGLEEKVIFYRIERELIVNEALKRASQED
jgi:hypothetical protein